MGYVKFSVKGVEWLLLTLSPNRDGVYKCRNLMTDRIGWFSPVNLEKAGLVI